MPSNRPNLTRPHLTLDEPSFQDLLSAAFTIQEHNDRRKQARQAQAELESLPEPETPSICGHCGASKPAEESRCTNCGLDQFRPGERLQRNWASMWLMSQEQGLWPERSAEIREPANTTPTRTETEAGKATGTETGAKTRTTIEAVRNQVFDRRPLFDTAAAKSDWTTESARDSTGKDSLTEDVTDLTKKEDACSEGAELAVQTFHLSASDDSFFTEAKTDTVTTTDAITETTVDSITNASAAANESFLHRLADLRVTLRFHRADLYLGAAICIATLALLWPAATSPRRPALGAWERALITLGIAEAPTSPVVRLPGDPTIEVWVDPHTALYYCPGEEPYGKTTDGRFSSQREAQMDRFEPASRAACE